VYLKYQFKGSRIEFPSTQNDKGNEKIHLSYKPSIVAWRANNSIKNIDKLCFILELSGLDD
jgi:hypothetical protein